MTEVGTGLSGGAWVQREMSLVLVDSVVFCCFFLDDLPPPALPIVSGGGIGDAKSESIPEEEVEVEARDLVILALLVWWAVFLGMAPLERKEAMEMSVLPRPESDVSAQLSLPSLLPSLQL